MINVPRHPGHFCHVSGEHIHLLHCNRVCPRGGCPKFGRKTLGGGGNDFVWVPSFPLSLGLNTSGFLGCRFRCSFSGTFLCPRCPFGFFVRRPGFLHSVRVSFLVLSVSPSGARSTVLTQFLCLMANTAYKTCLHVFHCTQPPLGGLLIRSTTTGALNVIP